jgi:hypothetical protein
MGRLAQTIAVLCNQRVRTANALERIGVGAMKLHALQAARGVRRAACCTIRTLWNPTELVLRDSRACERLHQRLARFLRLRRRGRRTGRSRGRWRAWVRWWRGWRHRPWVEPVWDVAASVPAALCCAAVATFCREIVDNWCQRLVQEVLILLIAVRWLALRVVITPHTNPDSAACIKQIPTRFTPIPQRQQYHSGSGGAVVAAALVDRDQRSYSLRKFERRQEAVNDVACSIHKRPAFLMKVLVVALWQNRLTTLSRARNIDGGMNLMDCHPEPV